MEKVYDRLNLHPFSSKNTLLRRASELIHPKHRFARIARQKRREFYQMLLVCHQKAQEAAFPVMKRESWEADAFHFHFA